IQNEMREAPALLRQFNPRQTADWLPVLKQKKKILLTGEGSSRIFPAHNLISQALYQGSEWHFHTEGSRQAHDYNLNDFAIIGASNSGQTKELISLFSLAKEQHIPCLALTATANSKITELADKSIILSCGKEQATAATKSVFEQALIYQSLLQGHEWAHKNQAADICHELLTQKISNEIIDILAPATCLYFAGRNDGVAEELTLKSYEITRKNSDYLEGTYILHGVEEVMQKTDTVILIEPFAADIEKIQSLIEQNIGLKIVAMASFDTPFPTIKLPALAGFHNYFQLMTGWNLLTATGLANGINLDQTRRARKLGNAV
ncbi:MAG TPA: SIS domain-containing protein, partial [Alphaproteobacteria bacterium]